VKGHLVFEAKKAIGAPARSRARSIVAAVTLGAGGLLLVLGAILAYEGMNWPRIDVGAIVSGMLTLGGFASGVVGVLLVVVGLVVLLTGRRPSDRP
jgi:hypothetical protein